MPAGRLLEEAAGLEYGCVVSSSSHELKADRKVFVGEAARHREGWQPAEISYAPQGIGETQAGHEIQRERSRGDRLRSGDQHIVGIEKRAHLLLQNFSHS